MDHGSAIQDGGCRRQVAQHPQDAAESEPSLLVFRTQLEGAQIAHRRLVGSAEQQVRFREEDPRTPVFVVAGDRLEERIARILYPRLVEYRVCVITILCV